jgi:predicted ester cyclase
MRNVQSTLLYKWFNEVWNNDDESAISRLMTESSFALGVIADDAPQGPEGFKSFFNQFRSQFHGVNITVEDVISQDDMEAGRTTVSAIHTDTGKPVTFTGMCMVKTEGGKIAKAWNNFDFLNLYQQLGQQLTAASN